MGDTKKVLECHIDAWNRRAVQSDPWSRDAELVAPGGVRVLGREAILEFERGFWTAFPDSTLELLDLIVDGGRAAGEGRLTGTHQGPLQTARGPVQATGRRLELRWVAMYRVVGDELVSEHLYFDGMEISSQLGLDS